MVARGMKRHSLGSRCTPKSVSETARAQAIDVLIRNEEDMGKDFKFKIHDDSERADVFMKVFGRLEICVTSFIAEMATLPGFDEPQAVFKLDMDRITTDERNALINHISDKFNLNHVLVDSQLAERGVPILASEGTLTVENPHRWIDLDDGFHNDDQRDGDVQSVMYNCGCHLMEDSDGDVMQVLSTCSEHHAENWMRTYE